MSQVTEKVCNKCGLKFQHTKVECPFCKIELDEHTRKKRYFVKYRK